MIATYTTSSGSEIGWELPLCTASWFTSANNAYPSATG